jgi:hypothetical protein
MDNIARLQAFNSALEYVPIDVYRCVKCGDIKRMKFN